MHYYKTESKKCHNSIYKDFYLSHFSKKNQTWELFNFMWKQNQVVNTSEQRFPTLYVISKSMKNYVEQCFIWTFYDKVKVPLQPSFLKL